ncbi:MAG: beta-lactamase family protein [Bacilli bacterium]|nr:beta-lactamase family protein [Bacilli bacterium]
MKDLDSYIDTLYQNQNIGADKTQKNLYSKEKYLRLLQNVLLVLRDNKDASIEELRNKLYEQSNLEYMIRDFFLDLKNAPGAVISYGTKNYQETITIGNKQEVIMENGTLVLKKEIMSEDAIFDLASTTKMYTSICILKLVQDNLLKLDDELVKYVPEFKYLNGVTILDLLTFEPLETPEKIDSTEDRNEAEHILFQATRRESNGTGIYNDIAPMALKYVIENITGMKYYDFLKQEVLDKINMNDTLVNIPKEKIDRVSNGNYDGRYDKHGNLIIRTKALKGIATDDKARILGQPEGNLSGHAGLFSTVSDMTKLARALIENKILNLEIRDEMAKNRRGYAFIKPDGTKNYAQYFGMLVYSKNPILASSEVRHFLSGKSFAAAGWSGTQTTIDPINNLNFTLLSNRSHNRMTYIDPSQRWRIIQNDVLGYRSIILPNGYEMMDATRYAFDRDEVINHCIELALEYKMLEEITEYSKNNDDIIENHKSIK